MTQLIDLTGQRFGKLTVIGRDTENKGKSVHWLCRCDCGNITSVSGSNLKNGHVVSCGCARNGMRLIDLTGQRFGHWTVLKKTDTPDSKTTYWVCRCDCGNVKTVAGSSLKRGLSTSCGCEKNKKGIGSPNFINLTGQRFGRLTVLGLDPEYENNRHWLCGCDCGNTISVTTERLKNGSAVSCGCSADTKKPAKIQKAHTSGDLAGKRFGRLTVIERAPHTAGESGGVKWVCRCDCGNETTVTSARLNSGHTMSCGCLKKETGTKRVRDLTGQRFGKLTVIGRDTEHTGKGIWWKCRCDCGREISVISNNLSSGNTASCGCARKKNVPGGPAFHDLTGQKFGNITVLRYDDVMSAEKDLACWVCKCGCGTVFSTTSRRLESGQTKSCGCLLRKKADERPDFHDLSGQRFGKLTAIRPAAGDSKSGVQWLCKCDCGNTTVVRAGHLIDGNTRSCGCNTESFGEQYIRKYLDDYGLVENKDYRTQVKFDDLHGDGGGNLSYDFEVFHPIHCLIEYQGKQHYQSIDYFGGDEKLEIQQEHDRVKADYAKEHDIPLYYLTYKDVSYKQVSDRLDEIFPDRQCALSVAG